MRSDGQRTHDRIIEVATRCFGTDGTDASLNQIAKRAGIGPGTLYRHFPTREHLIDACLDNWEVALQRAAESAIRTHEEPAELLLSWLDALVKQISVYNGGPARLLRALESRDALWARRWKAIDAANGRVLVQIDGQSALRDGVKPRLLGILVCGTAAAIEEGGLGATRRRQLLDLVANGLLEA